IKCWRQAIAYLRDVAPGLAPEPSVKRLLLDPDQPTWQSCCWKRRVLRCPARYCRLADPQHLSDLLGSEKRHTLLDPQRLHRPRLSAGTLAPAPHRLHLRYATSASLRVCRGSTRASGASSLGA